MRANIKHKRQAGLTLIELLIVMSMTAVLALALARAFEAELSIQKSIETRRTNQDQTAMMEREITRMLVGARLGTSTTDTTGFFQGVSDSGSSSLGSDRLTFTTTAPGVSIAALNSTDDSETQNQNIGPVGGLTEVSFGTSPVGNAGSKTGLFERIQHPSDSDPTQGGNESDLDDQIDTMGFQFWDGQEWVDTWDTTTGTTQLPEAVQVSYTLKDSTDSATHLFVVAIPASTVSPQNPSTTATSTSAGTVTGGGA